MSDLFHHSLSDDDIDAVFEIMGACDDAELGHTFQVLTKRADRARDYTCSGRARKAWNSRRMDRSAWPARNLHLGVSVENQKAADDRIPYLLQCPAAVRFISAEPLLEEVSLFAFLRGEIRDRSLGILGVTSAPGLDWVICGGESGPGARPCALEWLEVIVEQCRAASVPAFVKQLGAYVVSEQRACASEEEAKREGFKSRWLWRAGLKDRKGGDIAEFPEELRIRQFPGDTLETTDDNAPPSGTQEVMPF